MTRASRNPLRHPAVQRLIGTIGLALAIGVVLAGCAHVPVTSLWKLRSVDLETTDYAALRAAIRAPSALTPFTDGGHLTVMIWSEGQAPEGGMIVRARLEEVTDPAERALLADEQRVGDTVHLFRVAPEALPDLETVRTEIARRKAVGRGGNHLSVSIGADGCWETAPPPGPVRFSTYLRTEETGTFVPLTRDVDLRTIADGQDLAARMAICSKTETPAES